ncbi:glycosyltransferase family 4 protein [Pedobacter namyangjuensis]|uniref:glycosyltransferase family 4 protein n=1 Tax=Pedobacter namyangjuensis TaxID=600626 RepID=UPI000DE2EB7B|nr:glycosyltransferase family 1 protein [Pedobacter namyangjuensis]
MKPIGIEVQRLFREKKHGMEIVALEVLRELQQIKNDNNYIVYAKSDADNACLTESDNLKVKLLKGKTYFDWEQYHLSKEVNKNKPKFLHSTCNTSALNLSVPLVLTLHDIIYLEEINFKGTTYQNFGNIYRKFVVPRVVKKSEMIITVSHFERATIIEKLKVPEDRIKVVYNAVNKKFNNLYSLQTLSAFKKQHNLPDQFMLFLGNTAPKKNTVNVIKAYALYCKTAKDSIPLVILDYNKALVENILKEQGNEQILEKIFFPGFISSDEMALIYNAATLFLYPSLRESFGLPILEAMGCGTPVITSTTSSMPEVAGNAALLVDPKNAEDIADKMHLVLSDVLLQKSLSELGIKRAAEFSWKKSAEDLLAIYNLI